MSSHHGLVVVGVSSFDARLSMVGWAAVEAAARRAQLHLVTVCATKALPDQYLPADQAGAHRVAARRLLDDMARYVADVWPDLATTTELVEGTPAEALRTAAADADLLVVGSDDSSPFLEAIVGSVPGDLLTTAPCPLAVAPLQDWAAASSAPVLVALDEHDTARSALAYAFAAASRSDRPLSVMRCRPAGSAEQMPAVEQTRDVLGFAELYPDVTTTTEIAVGDATELLITASRGAALLVLGSRGRGRLASTLFGSVGRALIRRSGCPVVVARSETHRRQVAAG